MMYRKKPVIVEAIQWFKEGDHPAVIAEAKGHTGLYVSESWQEHMKEQGYPYGVHYIIKTLEGDMQVSVGDWIIEGVKGEVYPCKPDIFNMTYEPIAKATGGE